MIGEDRQSMASGDLNAVPSSHASAAEDRRVNPDIRAILLDRGAQHRRILGQPALREGGHHAPGTEPVDPQLHLAERERSSDPALLDEPVGSVRRLDHKIRAEARDFKSAGAVGGAQAIERCS